MRRQTPSAHASILSAVAGVTSRCLQLGRLERRAVPQRLARGARLSTVVPRAEVGEQARWRHDSSTSSMLSGLRSHTTTPRPCACCARRPSAGRRSRTGGVERVLVDVQRRRAGSPAKSPPSASITMRRRRERARRRGAPPLSPPPPNCLTMFSRARAGLEEIHARAASRPSRRARRRPSPRSARAPPAAHDALPRAVRLARAL